MSILNTTICDNNGANTGFGDCAIDPKLPQFIIRVPKSFELTEANMVDSATVMAKLDAATKADLFADRIFPYPQQVLVTDNSTDTTYQTLGAGFNVPVNEGMYDWTLQFIKGGKCLNDKLRAFNKSDNDYFFVVDADGRLFGRKVGTSLKGIPANYIFTDKLKIATDATITVYAYRVNFLPNYFNENGGSIPLDLGELQELSGLNNIIPSLVAPRATTTFGFRATTGCGGINLYDQYSTQLADPALYEFIRSGTSIVISSVTAVPSTKSFTVVLASSGAGTFGGSTVTLLDAAGVVGFEIQDIYVA